ncbi:sensor histidine kinase [Deinococcus aerophilus]|uniref:histidine kinase n=1 Tax=Deinococcus aerophilus TaxID=522488 RepID=A0ABQ2H018_9DEIO|nr:hypothetical protein GCM10010841_32900 [Deinococcus aerophilus]
MVFARPERREIPKRALDGEELTLEVNDDGPGPGDHRNARSGLGLGGMRERAESLGGRFHLEGGAAGGTRVVAWLPLAPEVDGE